MSKTKDSGMLVAEGKTKRVWAIEEPGRVLIESKDDITAGDGASHDVLEGKAEAATATTCNVFELLKARGMPTHYLERVDPRTFRALWVEMIPLELVARRIATGSYLKRRPDVAEGTVFDDLVIEFFEKDDANHDPLLVFDLVGERVLRYEAKRPLGEGFMSEQPLAGSRFADVVEPDVIHMMQLRGAVEQVFRALESAWESQEVALVDLKIECGFTPQGALVIADVIDNDSWRIWPTGDKAQMRDKQVYRDLAAATDPAAVARELGKIKQNYQWVAEATTAFVPAHSR